MTILVTGGAGYIGSHTCIKLLQAGHEVVVLDNFSNSHPEALRRVEQIAKRKLPFVQGDILDYNTLRTIFGNYAINAVVHFAGLKAVGESEEQPIKYYQNNISGSVALFDEMARAGVKTIVFSSSATVYGDPGFQQYRENTPLAPVNVYGRSKLIVENILLDIKKSQPSWRIAVLRYFNPVGAHVSGLIGEDPVGIPNNLMPFIAQVAVGKREKLHVFGGDYPTPDGTGRRDYIHVEDLAAGHLAALNKLMNSDVDPLITVNLGTGRPYSVLEMVHAFEKASNQSLAFEIVDRRAGDLAEFFADPTLAKNILGWEAQLGLDRICEDAWRWQSKNPDGYK